MNKLKKLISLQSDPAARYEVRSLNGREHYVLPVIAVKPGVLNGTFYSAEVLANTAITWNGVPVVVNHPKEGDVYVSANTPELQEQQTIGSFYNVRFADNGLKGEAWIDVNKAKQLGFNSLLQQFEAGKMMEVSVGLYQQADEASGQHNGKDYDKVLTGFVPDHLALLPNETGACSCEDGCGALRVNQLSYDEIHGALSSLIGESRWVYDVYEDFFIFRTEGEDNFYRLGWNKNSDNDVAIDDISTAQRVERTVEYVSANNKQGSETMPENEKEALVASLIENEATQFNADNKEWLESLDVNSLKLLSPVIETKAETEPEKQEAQADAETETEKQEAQSEVAANALSDEDMAYFQELKAKEQRRVDAMREAVSSHYQLGAEAVKGIPKPSLEAMHQKIPTPGETGNYALQGHAIEDETGKRYSHTRVITAPRSENQKAH